MDLQTPRITRRLNLHYEGPARSASQILYTPIKITQFEITESWLHPGKECLVFQSVNLNRKSGEIIKTMVFSESYSLIKTIRGTEAGLPHLTKIVRKRDGYLYFAALNDKEKKCLITI